VTGPATNNRIEALVDEKLSEVKQYADSADESLPHDKWLRKYMNKLGPCDAVKIEYDRQIKGFRVRLNDIHGSISEQSIEAVRKTRLLVEIEKFIGGWLRGFFPERQDIGWFKP
jgi:hypothetical protein